MNNEQIQQLLNRLNALENQVKILTGDQSKDNFTARQDFVKYSDFRTRIKIPHYSSTPSTCQVGEIIEVGGVEYICSATNTWTTVGGSSLRVKEVDGSPNVSPVTTIRFPNGSVTDDTGGQVSIAISGGGTPGGSDTQVQFNDSSAFGGDSAFTWTKSTNILTLDDGSNNENNDGATITGGGSAINIKTNDLTDEDFVCGAINITAGSHTGFSDAGDVLITGGDASDDNGDPGNIDIRAGVAGNVGAAMGTGAQQGGDITISSGNSDGPRGGVISLNTGFSTYATGTGGRLELITGGGNHPGIIWMGGAAKVPNLALASSTPNNSTFAGTVGAIYLENRTTAPTGTPSGGGILYSSSGALHWLGSSGTNTPIAPA